MRQPKPTTRSARIVTLVLDERVILSSLQLISAVRYGNPDGPQTSKVGIGLSGPLMTVLGMLGTLRAIPHRPRFLLEKENHLVFVACCLSNRSEHLAGPGQMILCLFFFLLLFAMALCKRKTALAYVPYTFKQRSDAGNNVWPSRGCSYGFHLLLPEDCKCQCPVSAIKLEIGVAAARYSFSISTHVAKLL